MNKIINTELPLDFDYFELKETQDTELMREITQEYNQNFGFTISYYCQQDPDMGNDPIFIEKADKKWVKPVKIKAISEYLQEVIENQRYGIQILDEIQLLFDQKYFLNTIKREPKIGDLIKVHHVNLMFEILNKIDSDSNFFGNKLNWKLTGKIWQEAHEDIEISQEDTSPGWSPDDGTGESEPDREDFLLNKKVDEKAKELFEYDNTNNPFGNY